MVLLMLRRVQACLRVSPAQPSFCSSLISPGHCLALIPRRVTSLPHPLLVPHQLTQQASSDEWVSPLPSAPQLYLGDFLSQSLDTKQPLLNIYPADRRQWSLLETSAGKSKQSKCHSHYILIIFQSLQMTLTSFCHLAPHLLRATIRVLTVTWHGATASWTWPQLKCTLRWAGAASLWRWDNEASDRWVSLLAGLQPARGKV